MVHVEARKPLCKLKLAIGQMPELGVLVKGVQYWQLHNPHLQLISAMRSQSIIDITKKPFHKILSCWWQPHLHVSATICSRQAGIEAYELRECFSSVLVSTLYHQGLASFMRQEKMGSLEHGSGLSNHRQFCYAQ